MLTSAEPGNRIPASKVLERPFTAGDSQRLLTLAAEKPLVASLFHRLPYVIGGVGLLVSLAIFAVIEAMVRRRDYALGLVDARTAELEESLTSLVAAGAVRGSQPLSTSRSSSGDTLVDVPHG